MGCITDDYRQIILQMVKDEAEKAVITDFVTYIPRCIPQMPTELPEEYQGAIDYQIYKLYKLTGKPAVSVPETSQETVEIYKKGELAAEVPPGLFDSFIYPEPMDSAYYPYLRDLHSCDITEALKKYQIVLGEIHKLGHEFDPNMEPEKKYSNKEIKIGKQLHEDLSLYMAESFIASLTECSCSCTENPEKLGG